jgi:hypothetical protein
MLSLCHDGYSLFVGGVFSIRSVCHDDGTLRGTSRSINIQPYKSGVTAKFDGDILLENVRISLLIDRDDIANFVRHGESGSNNVESSLSRLLYSADTELADVCFLFTLMKCLRRIREDGIPGDVAEEQMRSRECSGSWGCRCTSNIV